MLLVCVLSLIQIYIARKKKKPMDRGADAVGLTSAIDRNNESSWV